jgi:hypothetical protein
MPFLTDLDATKLDERLNKWRLSTPLRYWDCILREVIIAPADFVTNFATLYICIGPFIIRSALAYWLLGDLGDAAATIHDWLYSTQTYCRRKADAVFRRALIDLRIPTWRANCAWFVLRCVGWTVWNKVKRDKASGKFVDPIEQTIF